MTDEEIGYIAAKYGAWTRSIMSPSAGTLPFAREIIKPERERCAKICRTLPPQPPFANGIDSAIWNCALNEAARKIEGDE